MLASCLTSGEQARWFLNKLQMGENDLNTEKMKKVFDPTDKGVGKINIDDKYGD